VIVRICMFKLNDLIFNNIVNCLDLERYILIMEKIKDFAENNKKMVLGTLIVGSLVSGYMYLKKVNNSVADQKTNDTKFLHDIHFSQQNIPLYHKQAESRDKMISKVKYELFLILTKGDTYEGKITVQFSLGDKNIDELFLDF